MTRALTRDEIEQAYRAACRLEVRTLKPGNVHIFAAGHRMTVADFDTSTEVSAPHIADPTRPIGTRIRRAVEATVSAVAQNTNLGIVLLCAPLAAAAERPGPASLEDKLRSVLGGLDHDDAREVYKAIATANPAGLGSDTSGDVRADPPAAWTLLDAMCAAAPRDMIANEYATGFAGIFANARAFTASLSEGAAPEDALSLLFLRELASRPDTHIVRKHGPALARRVQDRAAEVMDALGNTSALELSGAQHRERLLALDTELKSWSANPGSLADLMCASVFTSALQTAALHPAVP